MPIKPGLCSACGGGSSTSPEFEHNSTLLCDTLPDGTVVAAAVLVQEYDEVTGLPVGGPVAHDPVTGAVYVPVGTLKACAHDCDQVTSDLLCDNTLPGVYTPYILTQVFDCQGVLLSTSTRDLTGAGYIPLGIPGTCPDNEPQFAGFVCDAFGGSAAVPATPPTCPGGALGAAANFQPGSGEVEGPAGTWTQTANVGASLTWVRSTNDDQHAICTVKFVNDASTGNNPGWQLFGSFVDVNGGTGNLDAVWITAIEAALGTSDLTPIPAGSTATANVGGTAVTITFDGPSNNSEMFASNGAFFYRDADGDGQAAGVTLDFNPPVQSFTLGLNNAAGDPGTISGIQEAQAAPGTAAIPAQPPSNTTIKQFRNADGTSFYENLDGTTHAVLGVVGDCGEFFQEVLCDATGTTFLRLYHLTNGSVAGTQDYDLDGAVFAAVDPVGRCSETLATYRHTPAEVLCYTAADGVTVTQFLRRYLINQDGLNVVAVIDTLLDGITGFTAFLGGTVGICSDDSGSSTTGCTTKSSIGTICYVPPSNSVPAQTIVGDWRTATQVGSAGGPQTFTQTNWQGTGRTVVVTETIGSGRANAGQRIHLGFQTGPETNSVAIDNGAPISTVTLQFDGFGTNLGDKLTNFSPPFTSVTGAGTAAAGNTEIDPTTADGTIFVHFAGPLQNISFDWSDTGAGGTHLTSITNVVPAVVGSTTMGTAAVTVDCATGVVSYIDLASGQPLDITTVTIVDCNSATTSAVTLSSQGRLLTNATPWTPADVTGTLTSATFTVISGTANFVDSNGTAVGPLPTGATFGWAAADENSLTAPQSVTPAAGATVLAVWSEK